ncbi:FlgB family protein [Paracoccus sp. S-4012]|uniref:FlgB family protein n=1 Tax=Paracoccus sp. S-4012 TaxID=2665648 RepID=UPI0012B017D8|nr:FlgB family protein [Paracoccus sp. S-4012]MRX49250.1 FlgB family protein [Paracoccus sp. S-4012]
MLGNIETMRIARAMMTHAGARQLEVARNVANADTPGYRARDVAAFEPGEGPAIGLRATRMRHLAGDDPAAGFRRVDAGGEASPNGNTVSLEGEMLRGAETKRQHDIALAVYQSGLRLMRGATGRR